MLVDSFRVNVGNMVYTECLGNRSLMFRWCLEKHVDTNHQCINCLAKMVSEAATWAVFQQVNVDLWRYYVVIVQINASLDIQIPSEKVFDRYVFGVQIPNLRRWPWMSRVCVYYVCCLLFILRDFHRLIGFILSCFHEGIARHGVFRLQTASM